MADKSKTVVAPDKEVEQYDGEEFSKYMETGERPARFMSAAPEPPELVKKEEKKVPLFQQLRDRNKALREAK